jgi:hypothetical protein
MQMQAELLGDDFVVGAELVLDAALLDEAENDFPVTPPKTSQLISRLLSAGILIGGGAVGSASDVQSPQRASTFMCSMPVCRLSRAS